MMAIDDEAARVGRELQARAGARWHALIGDAAVSAPAEQWCQGCDGLMCEVDMGWSVDGYWLCNACRGVEHWTGFSEPAVRLADIGLLD